MDAWITNQFEGYYPVGAAAVVVAPTIERAVELLEEDLAERGIPQKLTTKIFRRLDTEVEHSVVLVDGNY